MTSQQSSTTNSCLARASHSIGRSSDSSLQKALDLAKEHAAGIKYGSAMPLESVELLGKLIGESVILREHPSQLMRTLEAHMQ